MKYHFYTDNEKKVVCVTTFAKKPVKGFAICSDEDTFDLEAGKRLAQARADVKWAGKRCDFAKAKYLRMCDKVGYWHRKMLDAERYLDDCEDDYLKYAETLNDVSNEMIGDGAKI